MNNKEKDNNILIAYNSMENIYNIFDYIYGEVENQNTFRKKYKILQYSAIMSATIFGVICSEIIFDINLCNMNFLTIKGRDPSSIDLLLIRMEAGIWFS